MSKNPRVLCLFLGLSLGLYFWLALHGYIWASDHAWFTGTQSAVGVSWRTLVIHGIDVGQIFWQIPVSAALVGLLSGIFFAAVGLDFQRAISSYRFAAEVIWRRPLKMLLLGIAFPLAPFFLGKRAHYEGVGKDFRPSWHFPGWVALIATLIIYLVDFYFDVFDGFTLLAKVQWMLLPFWVFVAMIFDEVLSHIRNGIWLDRSASVTDIKKVLRLTFRWSRIKHLIAISVCQLTLLFFLAVPVLAVCLFSIYESQQLMQNLGQHVPKEFAFFANGCRFLVANWVWLVWPISVFFSLVSARLWVELSDQH